MRGLDEIRAVHRGVTVPWSFTDDKTAEVQRTNASSGEGNAFNEGIAKNNLLISTTFKLTLRVCHLFPPLLHHFKIAEMNVQHWRSDQLPRMEVYISSREFSFYVLSRTVCKRSCGCIYSSRCTGVSERNNEGVLLLQIEKKEKGGRGRLRRHHVMCPVLLPIYILPL